MSLRRALAGVLAALVALTLLVPALVAGAEQPDAGEADGPGFPAATTSTTAADRAPDDGPAAPGVADEQPSAGAPGEDVEGDDDDTPRAERDELEPFATAAAAGPVVVGEGCSPGTGVTVVVDFTTLLDEVHVGCAPGEQASGLSAMAAAGFTTTDESGAGTVCTIDARPSEGFPFCWLTGGYWSYWKPSDASAWGFSEVGAGAGPLAPGSVEGWSWAASFDGAAPRLDLDAIPVPVVDPPDEPWVDADAAAALDWLSAQLDANDGTLPGFAPGTPDWGLTADAVLALAVAGRDDWQATQRATTRLAGGVTQYATWDDLGPEYAGVRIAGSFAKLLVVAGATGADHTDFGGWDLDAEVRALMRTSGEEVGRFSDLEPHFGTDASNGFGQALAVIGLAGTDDGVPQQAIEFLLAQQCPGGGFRLVYGATPGCVDAAEADSDTTALAMQALLAVERTDTVGDALSGALRWLLDRQDESTGGWGGTGPTAAVNANSTALIGQLVGAVGQDRAAADAAAHVRSLQLRGPGGGVIAGDDGAVGPTAEGDEGAIAYDAGAFAAVVDGSIEQHALDQWRRATTQAVLALDLPLYLQAVTEVEVAPVDPDGPVPPTTTTTTAPPSTTTTSMPTTTAPDGATTSVPDEPTTTVAGGLGGGGDVGAGGQGAAPAVTPTGALPYTGGDVARLVLVAAALLGLGLLARSAARRQR